MAGGTRGALGARAPIRGGVLRCCHANPNFLNLKPDGVNLISNLDFFIVQRSTTSEMEFKEF